MHPEKEWLLFHDLSFDLVFMDAHESNPLRRQIIEQLAHLTSATLNKMAAMFVFSCMEEGKTEEEHFLIPKPGP